MTGLFGSKDPQKKRNVETIKRVRSLVRKKRYDEALRDGLEYLKHVPHNHDILFIVGGIYCMREEWGKALRYLERASEIGSYDTEMLFLKANAHHHLGQRARAIECCNRILEVDQNNAGARELLDRLDLQA